MVGTVRPPGAAYWQRQGWLVADFSRLLVRRKPRLDRAWALSRGDVEQLLTFAETWPATAAAVWAVLT